MKTLVIVLAASFVVLALPLAEASATQMTEQQVKNVCQGDLKEGGVKGANVIGCDKKCGNTWCTYNCCEGPKCGEQGCHGHALGLTRGGMVKVPMSAFIRLQ